MGVVQFIERDVYHQVFLRQSHILIHLNNVIQLLKRLNVKRPTSSDS